jgi:hypothetical protein
MGARVIVKREVAIRLLAAWLASWAAEEHALQSAARDHMLSPAAIRTHLETIKAERDEVRSLLG